MKINNNNNKKIVNEWGEIAIDMKLPFKRIQTIHAAWTTEIFFGKGGGGNSCHHDSNEKWKSDKKTNSALFIAHLLPKMHTFVHHSQIIWRCHRIVNAQAFDYHFFFFLNSINNFVS